MLTAIIMASGFSARLGEKNKLLLPLGNKTVIEWVLENVTSCDFDKIILVANDNYVIEYGFSNNVYVVENKNPELGQSQSLKLGVLHSDEKSDYIFFVGDQPFLSKTIITKIKNCHLENPNNIIIPISKGNRQSGTIFPNSLRSELLKLKGDIGGRFVIKNNEHLVKTIVIENQKKDCFLDIDTDDDYLKAITSISTGASSGNLAT